MARYYDNDAHREDFMALVYDELASDPTNDRANRIIDAYDAAPTVDAETVRRGKWMQDDTWKDLYFCSVCLTRDHRKPKHRYCPDCGARMDEVGE